MISINYKDLYLQNLIAAARIVDKEKLKLSIV